ncbi:hypothetical protein [Glycomyces niveus]|uniref:BetI-type transcriptional repressor C-terminal domain-containing protein n=1 Tax=Glycomyces niveus TaxID=2820287 RepID=A0ABS3U2J1_9ACTN|nr:hypothetical protein [Glycomyces sp. NEAU-S30]MBO3732989.1 hypothetical protein [Glycomyces sp. NEAU-S30]
MSAKTVLPIRSAVAEPPLSGTDGNAVQAFFGRLASEPKVAAILTDGDDEIRELGAAAVHEAQDAGRADPGLSPEREADLLLTLAVSFGVDVAVGQRTIEDARAALEYALARALGPSPGAAA